MNSALIVEECYRDAKDKNIDFQLILLDAKATFDTVVHSHMLRRVFLAGIDNRQKWINIKFIKVGTQNSSLSYTLIDIKRFRDISIPFYQAFGIFM
jgi:hypothetical protein